MEKDTETKLIETAISLFAQKGFAGVSIRELAREANVNSALISYHFGGKEGLYKAVMEEQFSPIAQVLKQFANMVQLSPRERLHAYAKNIVIIHRERPFLAQCFHIELANPSACCESVIKKYVSQMFQFIHKTLAEGVENGDFKADLQIEYATISLAGIMNFFFITKPIFQEFQEFSAQLDEEYATQAIDIFLNGIIRREEHE